MALTTENLDRIQEVLLRSFEKSASNISYSSAEDRLAISHTAQALFALENERRLQAEYKPHKTLQKD
jgi:hypothetical protein